MKYSKKKDRFILLFASLLHDIGKFKFRAEKELKKHQEYGQYFVREYFREKKVLKNDIEKICSIINVHHSEACPPTLKRADHLDASVREEEQETNARRPLRSIFPDIQLENEGGNRENLVINQNDVFSSKPVKLSAIEDKNFQDFLPERGWEDKQKNDELISMHHKLWVQFAEEIKRIPNKLNERALIRTLYHILWKYTFRVSSAGYHCKPNIPLFDHLRITAAIEDCLYCSEESDKPFLIIEGDFSGIQKFIYFLAEPDTKSPKLAKRLRGRSFFLSLLSESIAHSILDLLDLYEVHLIINGGGHFDILAPNTSDSLEKLKSFEKRIGRWLYKTTEGILSLNLAWEAFPSDQLNEFGKIKRRMSYLLQEKKSQRSFYNLKEVFLLKDDQRREGVCNVCGVDVFKEGKQCPLCEQTVELGKEMMYADYLINLKNIKYAPDKLPSSVVYFEELNECWLPVRERNFVSITNRVADLIDADAEVNFNVLNTTDFNWKRVNDFFEHSKENLSCGFIFVGNYAPHEKGSDAIYEFDEIARLDENGRPIPVDKKFYPMLSVARLDVDYLGAIFATGLKKHPFLSYHSSLSRELHFFFTAFVNHLAKKHHIYITYSGGDDLFVVGRWDYIIEFVFELNGTFKQYACENPGITISGGIYSMRPGFPIRVAAHKAGKEEENAKDYVHPETGQQKNAISIFGKIYHWNQMSNLIEYGKKLVELIENDGIPRSFIHLLADIESRKLKNQEKGIDDLEWIYDVKHLIHYSLARRKVTAEKIRKIDEIDGSEKFRIETLAKLLEPNFINQIRVPASYALYKTRSI